MNDLRHALRLLAKSPGFTLVAVLTLAVGLGANTTVMSWIRGILLEPLPGVPDQERVLVLAGKSRSGDDRSWSVPDLRSLQEELDVAGIANIVGVDMLTLSLTTGDRPEKIWGSIVTGNFFDALEVPVTPGRAFRKEEDGAPGGHPVVVLSHDLWSRRFGADPATVGKTILLNRHPFTVIGVAAPGFQGAQSGLRVDLWVPLAMQETVMSGRSRLDSRGSHWMQALARLRPGVTMEQAQAALDGVAARLGREYPETNDGMRFLLFRFWNAPMGPSKFLMPVLVVLASMAALVLLLACANVANLLLVGALDRRRETRSALLASVDLFPNGYDETRGRVFYREALRRLAALPGVESASVAIYLPLDLGGSGSATLCPSAPGRWASARPSERRPGTSPAWWSAKG